MLIVECKLIISDGRNRKLIKKIKRAIMDTPGCELSYVDAYRRKNYLEISFFGEPEAAIKGAHRAINIAAQGIDMGKYLGDRPRLGACDSVRFSPISGLGLGECAVLSRKLGDLVARSLNIPVYFYGSDAGEDGLCSLDDVRHNVTSDFGKERHPTAGAIAIGAGGTTSGAEGIRLMLLGEMREELAAARRMRHSSRMATRIGGYFRTVDAVITAAFKSLIYSRSWPL